MESKKYDIVIIGGGPSGISAALYLRNANFSVAVIHNNKSALKKAENIKNYYGYNPANGDFTGENLYNTGLKQAEIFGAEVFEDEVFGVDYIGDFLVSTAKGAEYTSYAVLMSAGEEKANLKIRGFSEFLTKGISFCAICDAFLYRKKNIAVYGNGEYALHEASELAHSANKVTILTDGKEIKANFKNFEVNEKKVKQILGEGRLNGVEFEDGSKLLLDGLFVAADSAGSVTIAKKIGAELNEKGDKIIVNDNFKTNIDGLYAAGDTVNDVKQIASAVYSGMTAAFDIIKFLRNKSLKIKE